MLCKEVEHLKDKKINIYIARREIHSPIRNPASRAEAIWAEVEGSGLCRVWWNIGVKPLRQSPLAPGYVQPRCRSNHPRPGPPVEAMTSLQMHSHLVKLRR